jgi:Spy/CpxP family protein refolding chaperone
MKTPGDRRPSLWLDGLTVRRFLLREGTMRGGFVATLGGFAALWLFGSLAVAQPFGPGREGPPEGPPLGRAARVLDLTEQQQEATRQIFEQRRPQVEALRKEMRENRQQLKEALESGHADPTAVGELVIAGHALRQEGRRLREESKAQLQSLLTPEQQLKLEALEAVRDEVGPGPRGRKGRRGRPWGPSGVEPEEGE